MARGLPWILSGIVAVFIWGVTPPSTFSVEQANLVGTPPQVVSAEYENLLIQGLEKIQDNRLNEAREDFASLTQQKPDFKLAQLIYGDLLMARVGPLKGFGNVSKAYAREVSTLLEEARARVRHQKDKPPPETIPEHLLALDPEHPHAAVVDISRSRLYVFESQNGIPRLIADFYVSSGKNGKDKVRQGDKKTPIGVYFITGYMADEQLPDFYGAGALPLNYPNEWDRRLKRTGYGIWLHGTPVDTYSRPPRASDGCVALTNPDFKAVEQWAAVGSPVVISDQVTWVELKKWDQAKQEALARVESWRRDWESRESKRFLGHYSATFRSETHDYALWARQIHNAFKQPSALKVELSNISILRYPGNGPMLLVTFDQVLTRDDRSEMVRTRQYWRQEEGKWRIVYQNTV